MAAGFPVWYKHHFYQNGGNPAELMSGVQLMVDFRRLMATNLRVSLFGNVKFGPSDIRLKIGGTWDDPTDGEQVLDIPNLSSGFGYGSPFRKTLVIPNDWSDFEIVKVTGEGAAAVQFLEIGVFLEGTEDAVTPPEVTSFNATNIDVSGTTLGAGYPSDGTMGWCQDLNFNKKPFHFVNFGAEVINPATVTGSTFFVTDAADILNTHIAGTVGVGSPLAANTVWFQPTNNIHDNGSGIWRIHITSGIENMDGDTAVPETWDFFIASCA